MLRGDVYRFLVPKGTGLEQRGNRYGVLIQANELLPRSVVLMAPTSLSARPASYRPEVEVRGARTRVLVEQMAAVDVARLGELEGHLGPEELWGVAEAIATVVGLRGSTS